MAQSILLVEPDAILGEVYQKFLQKQGYQVIWEQTAESAVHSLDAGSVNLIILELQIAGHNGLEFLYEIRSYADLQDIPVIINSFISPATIKISDSQKELGIVSVLYKPDTTLQKLLKEIKEQLQKIPA